ncbi:uncharacterized protein STEHIDRAFT_138129 [Stereum hirsutum FP-91666 SS1]|uniref:uncharacterized protein n=1 Tax=Stereum hirsutum (strain FP-91666) TaxID=721885 RepID=UPI000440E44C|nr:uncharacterized protein STEHIDRAFT_138129 [Stereum hirsutum FP-91666 SS1]EIM89017.1 hypothetical protein STEHIDRAFT_138129 [Stereum hirsutum FP-91666 SS1]
MDAQGEQAWNVFLASRLVASGQSPPTNNAHIHFLDVEIERSHRLTSSLIANRNALVPIIRVPSEILAHIFEIIITADWDDFADIEDSDEADALYPSLPRFRQPFVVLVTATHVCRRFRDVALDTPSLWRNIIWERSNWAQEMLLRVKQTALDIRAIDVDPDATGLHSFPTDQSTTIARTALPYLARARSLCLEGPAPETSVLVELLSRPAPLLESARLEYQYFGGNEQEPSGQQIYPDILFGKHAPRLRHLSLCGDIQPSLWSSPIMSGLKSLTMMAAPHESIHLRERACIPPSLHELMQALERMQQLWSLTVHQWYLPLLPQGVQALPEVTQIIHLPQLKHLSLIAPFADCLNLSQRLTIHPNASLSYGLANRGMPMTHLADTSTGDMFTSLLKPCSITPSTFTHLTLSCKSKQGYTLQGWDEVSGPPRSPSLTISSDPQPDPYITVKPRLNLDIVGKNEVIYPNLLPSVLQTYRFPAIRTFTCALCRPLDAPLEVRRLFLPLKTVEEVIVDGHSQPFKEPKLSSPLLHALADGSTDLINDNDDVLFPKMRTLSLVEFSFLKADGPTFEHEVVDVLRRIIGRKRASVTLQSLHIENCEITEGQVDVLRPLIPDFRWDGKVEKRRWEWTRINF